MMDKTKFTSLILPLKDRLFRIAWHIVRNREEAEDVVQEVMLKVWKMENQGMNSIEAYCYTMARNLALNQLALKDNRNAELKIEYDREKCPDAFDKIVETEKGILLRRMIY